MIDYITKEIKEQETELECSINDWGFDFTAVFIKELILKDRITQLSLLKIKDKTKRLKIWDNGYTQGYYDGECGNEKHKDLNIY